MPSYGGTSRAHLSTCHRNIQKVFYKVIERYDCTVIIGHRDKETQNKAFKDKRSKVEYPNSFHNQMPSLAIDVAPYLKDYPGHIDWRFHRELKQAIKEGNIEEAFDIVHNIKRWYHFAAFVIGVAFEMGIKIRWGGDWDGDFNFKDQNFHDLPHFKLVMA